MNKSQFLKQLRYRLEGRLPAEELADVLSYYEAYFDDSEEDEETVAERLGSPASVAEQVLKDAGESARRVTTPPPAPAGRRRWVVPLIIAIVLVIVLAIFVLPSTLLLALRTDSSRTPTVETTTTPVLVADNSDVSVALTPFDALELDVDVASFQIKTGSEWTIRLVNRSQDTSEDSYQLNYRNRDGVLSVWSTPYPSDVPSAQRSADVQVEVTVPEGTTLDRAELTIGVGDLVWEDCTVSGKLNVESGVGDATLKLAAPVDEADILTGTGDLTFEIADSQSGYSWLLSSGTGDIRLNGETMQPFWSEGGSGQRTLSLVSGTGDVSLVFQ